MTSTLPARTSGAGGVAPLALVSETALRRNAPGATGGVDDVLAADAWGHGAAWVASVLSDLEMDAAGLDAARLFGLPGSGAEPVLSLRGRALGTKPLLRGEGVSYGYTHRASRDTTVALVTGGYAQGVVRALGNAATVSVDGRRHPIVGRVAMDVCVVDVGETTVDRGTEVVFFGDPAHGHPSLHEWTDATGWSAAEIIAVVGARADRRVTT
ncbi:MULTISPECIES: alanine racemase C-terminal domain-containing protein [Microbacterium]|uniref:alanine racemase C-terminal domain-containing protein n=1 Tax=Microbacterium TaxID=33882 RepID=UPI00278A6420|nr:MULTISPECIES: alanine racemase C-terminal domain-containing protein [Microbacterium]MDQ1084206.1 alanine racemase [Microbacterium sp. SORGH_AS_0344]MDQ1170519.1 alanine racemase [Microbacterium proteolyticum]